MTRPAVIAALLIFSALVCPLARANILWSNPASRVIHATPESEDILGGAVSRDNTANDALYFKLHVDPLSDVANEPYYALFQLSENGTNRLALGNALEAWGYSAAYAAETSPANKEAEDAGEYNLQSAHPEGSGLGHFLPYELPSHNHPKTIVFKVQYVPGGDDLVTVWLDPDLHHGATAENQPENIITKFKANASFNEIRLRHFGTGPGGGGNGWIFSDMAIATSFDDFVVVRFWQTWWFRGLCAVFVLAAVGTTVRLVEQRKYQRRLLWSEQARAVEQERARISQDLHDDLGSSLTRISLLSQLLRSDKEHPAQVEAHAAKLAESADQTVRALEEIVWAVRPDSDSLQSLVEYVAHFANEMFDESPTRCRLDLPSELPARPLPPDVRHNIFLIAKEALTNVSKHAGAGVVNVQIKTDGPHLTLVIEDDGKGFKPGLTAGGEHNGLVNMQRRSAAVGGQLNVTSEPGRGARVEFKVQFPD